MSRFPISSPQTSFERDTDSSQPSAPAQALPYSILLSLSKSPHGEQSPIGEQHQILLQQRQRRPVATWVIIAVNVLVWLAMIPFGGSTNPYVLIRFGAKVNSQIVQGQIWRLATPIFLHVGIIHLAFNAYALYVFGPQIEGFFGTVRFLIIYVLSGTYGVLLSFALSPHAAVGASGAIFGLIGTQAMFFFHCRNVFGQRGRQRLYNLLIVIGYNLAFTFAASSIDVWGHLGGLLSGILLGRGTMPHYAVSMTEGGPRLVDRNRPERWGMVVLGAIVILALSVWLAVTMQTAGV